MTRPARQPLFLGKASYRRRRLNDAARLLPVVGTVLWLLPLLWPVGEKTVSTSTALIYVFSVWIGLVVLSAVLSRVIGQEPEADAGERGD